MGYLDPLGYLSVLRPLGQGGVLRAPAGRGPLTSSQKQGDMHGCDRGLNT